MISAETYFEDGSGKVEVCLSCKGSGLAGKCSTCHGSGYPTWSKEHHEFAALQQGKRALDSGLYQPKVAA